MDDGGVWRGCARGAAVAIREGVGRCGPRGVGGYMFRVFYWAGLSKRAAAGNMGRPVGLPRVPVCLALGEDFFWFFCLNFF
jgi:hypothetical protein